jgi:hypothetical protein
MVVTLNTCCACAPAANENASMTSPNRVKQRFKASNEKNGPDMFTPWS